MTRGMLIRRECFPFRRLFRISRGSKAVAQVITVELDEGGAVGRGECVPYGRYGETVEAVAAALESHRRDVEAGMPREAVQSALPAGAARNALDCALWDLEAKLAGRPAWQLAGLPPPAPLTTAFTIAIDTPVAMAMAAREASGRPLLKLKLHGDGDLDRVRAVRAAAPQARLIVDANEGWTPRILAELGPPLAMAGVELIEQPLPAGQDEALRGLPCPVPLGADESFHLGADLDRLRGLYQVLNLKLDKTGGLTEALKVKAAATAAGFRIMVGCMVGSSLSMAPAVLLAQDAAFVDLDGPLLLAEDRHPALRYDSATVYPPDAALWG